MNTIVMAPTVLPDAPPLDYIRGAIAGGFKAIGLRLHRSLVMPYFPVVGDAALIREIKQMTADIDVMEITSFYLLPEMDFDEYKGAMELGAELGGKYMLVIGRDTEWPRMVENFRKLCDLAATMGMTCALENVGDNTVPRMAKLIAEAGVSNGGICLDPVNHYLAGGTNADLAAMDPKLFPYTQVADAVMDDAARELVNGRPKHLPRLLLGDGNLDLYGMLDALPANLPLSLELPLSTSALQPGANGQLAAPAQWTKRIVDTTQLYLDGYYRARNR